MSGCAGAIGLGEQCAARVIKSYLSQNRFIFAGQLHLITTRLQLINRTDQLSRLRPITEIAQRQNGSFLGKRFFGKLRFAKC